MPDTRTIQKQIIDALGSTLSATIQRRGDDATVIDNGNIDISYQYGTVTKILSATLEVQKTMTGDVATGDYLAQLDEAYGDYLALIFTADQTLGGLADEIVEAPTSPEFDLRDAGSKTLTMRINFAITYRHNDTDPRSQTNSD